MYRSCHYLLWIYAFEKFIFCRIQPVYVVDVAAAIISALKDDGTSMGKVYELGGPEIFTVHQLVMFSAIVSFLLFSILFFGNSEWNFIDSKHAAGRTYV